MHRCSAVLAFLGSCAAAAAQPLPTYEGTLEPELAPSVRSVLLRLEDATDEHTAGVDLRVPEGRQLLVADGRRPGGGGSFPIFLSESTDATPVVYLDADLDGRVEPTERFELLPSNNSFYADSVVVQFPLPQAPYPVRFALPSPDLVPATVGQRFVIQSIGAKVVGSVVIDGAATRVELPYDLETDTVPLTTGDFAVDVDGDGDIPADFTGRTPERARAEDERIVFRIGSRYVSFESADRASGVFTMREHRRTDYRRIELTVGTVLTDFDFLDLDERERRLSDFRGQFLLLDFWGTWCGPCVREIPNLKAAHARFRERGFEILGIDHGDEVDDARAFIAERDMDWPQVHPDSGDSLVGERFRIDGYPTYVLLDPAGTILSLGQEGQLPLRGEALLDTLEQVLPTSGARR